MINCYPFFTGANLSVLLAMLCPSAGIEAVIAQCGYTNPSIPWFSEPGSKTVMDKQLGSFGDPNLVIEDYLNKHVRSGTFTVCTSGVVVEDKTLRMLTICYIQSGRFTAALGPSERVVRSDCWRR